jgi:RNA polymerase sigma factor (sigma-70 family)
MDHSAFSSPGLSQETDADLLVFMSMRESEAEEAVARDAWAEFHRRHVEYVHHVCTRFRKILGGDAGVCDLVQDTLQRVYEKADQFDPEGVAEPAALRLRVRAWMGRIAHNLLCSKLRADNRLPTQFLDQDQWQDVRQASQSGDNAADVPTSKTLYQRALETLTEREREVLRLYGLYFRLGKVNQKLPDGVAETAATRLGTTPENLRQLKKRSLEKIAAFIQNPEHGL